MAIVLPTFAVAFAAFAIWLTVRIVNRRERWAKRTAAGLVVAVAYLICLHPIMWMCEHGFLPECVFYIYYPVVWLARWGPVPIRDVARYFVGLP